MSYEPLKSLLQLQPGASIRLKPAKFGTPEDTVNYVVTGNYGKFVTAVAQGVVTDPRKWEIWVPGGSKKGGRYV
jgi:hypothetical protein